MKPTRWSWLCLALVLAACGGSKSAQRPEDVPPPPPEPQSSLAVLIEHRAELGLSTEQLGWLQNRDDQLQKDNAAPRKKIAEAFGQGGRRPRRGGGGGMPAGMEPGNMGRSPIGGGMPGQAGMGGMGMPRGGMRAPEPEEVPPELPEARRVKREQARAALRELQDNDTRAYTDAEAKLTEAQKPRARELVSQAREQWLQRQEAVRERLDGP